MPNQSHEYTNFDPEAMEAFKTRVREALGDGSKKAVPMKIVNQEPGDLPHLVDSMIDQEDDDFAVSSFDIVKKLNDSQQTKSIPGGIVVVFTGTIGAQPKQKFLGVMKAELHSAYEKSVNDEGEISLKFIREVLLTPSSKLYKTAAFFEQEGNDESQDLNDRWHVVVSDFQMGNGKTKPAAQYFYADFLGCGHLDSNARTTWQFFESTKKYVGGLDVSAEQKNDLLNALNTYLKVDTSSTISTTDYAEKYLDESVFDDYTQYMSEAGVPEEAFVKDTEQIESDLKQRRVSFRSKLKFTGPAEKFKQLVVIESIEGDPDESGAPQEWTQITVKDRITDTE